MAILLQIIGQKHAIDIFIFTDKCVDTYVNEYLVTCTHWLSSSMLSCFFNNPGWGYQGPVR